MRVLAHIHTFNDTDIIDRTIAALLRQTRIPDDILVVDNASTDETLDRPSVRGVIVRRHPENRGTSGAVYTGMQFAIEHDYDWIWVFDADSIPEPDALEKLLDLYAGWSPQQQDETAFLACLHYNIQDGLPRHGGVFEPDRIDQTTPPPEARVYPCHFVIWSGCLYRVAALRAIGLPNPDYVLDWGEGEYGYRIMTAGYKGFICRDAVLHHNIRGFTSYNPIQIKFGPVNFTLFEFSPIRLYYQSRNVVYFLLYEFVQGRRRLLLRTILGVAKQTAGFLLLPRHHGRHIAACVRGLWHGLTGNISARY